MYLLPEKLALDELVGQQINMVCLGPYDVQIMFEKGTIIQSLLKLEIEENNIKNLLFENELVDTSHIIKITKNEVKGVKRKSDTEFHIELNNNISLCFHTEESQYESINISMPNGALEII
jgi:hypothetical protein